MKILIREKKFNLNTLLMKNQQTIKVRKFSLSTLRKGGKLLLFWS